MASKTSRPRKRIKILLRAASMWGDQIAPMTPCRSSCSACCHIPVVVSQSEAQLLADASGRELKVPPFGVAATVASLMSDGAAAAMRNPDAYVGVPCPFLTEGNCSVYEVRPLACRTHFSLAEDDLLCHVVPGHPVDVPQPDARLLRASFFSMMEPDEAIADLRDFF
ncbi:YkgJ family cysteine cluster protein [Xanthomonas euvesicatoria]